MSVGTMYYLISLQPIGPFKFEWHGQNKVGNIAILVLWRDHEKLRTFKIKNVGSAATQNGG